MNPSPCTQSLGHKWRLSTFSTTTLATSAATKIIKSVPPHKEVSFDFGLAPEVTLLRIRTYEWPFSLRIDQS